MNSINPLKATPKEMCTPVLVPILILADLFFGFSSYSIGPIAHFAHVGGAITGLAMMWYWKKKEFNNNRWDL